MGMLHRLWLAIALTTGIGFIGSLLVSLWTARAYLEQQLYAQSIDGANSLALSMSQQPKDRATLELMISALFDNGHYQQIRYTATDGTLTVERQQEAQVDTVPDWFEQLLPITLQAATAQVNDGWRQAGTLSIEVHPRFAYESLWRGAGRLFGVCALIGLLAGWLGSLLVRQISQPLRRLMEQAQAISERRFVTLEEPAIPELQRVTRALNSSVLRLKSLFEEEAARIDTLRRDASYDALTGLANRRYFLGRLNAQLCDSETGQGGQLALLRLSDLRLINEVLGQQATDQLLARLGEALSRRSDDGERLGGRLGGGELALLLPNLGAEPAENLLTELGAEATVALRQAGLDFKHRVHLALIGYQLNDPLNDVLQQAEQALAQAASSGSGRPAVLSASGTLAAPHNWKTELEQALTRSAFLLHAFPVQTMQGQLLHEELVLRLVQDHGEALPAAAFLSDAARAGLLPAIDREVLRLALDWLTATPGPIAINLSGELLRDAALRQALRETLQAEPALARHLWLELSEAGIGTWRQEDIEQFANFAASIRPLGVKVGIDHFGRRFDQLPRLHELGLDYLKIDAGFIHGIDQHAPHQSLLKAMLSVAHSLEMQVLAVGVNSRAEWDSLAALGMDGLTGPVMRLRGSASGNSAPLRYTDRSSNPE